MKKTLSLACVTAGLALVTLLGGCDTFDSRAEQKSATFNSLDENTKDRLHKGIINVGDTPDMVYIALGVPDSKRQRVTKDSREVTWIYRTYYYDYAGLDYVGYHRFFSPFGPGRYAVYWEPMGPGLYHDSDENMRVTFENGHVIRVEQKQNSNDT